MSSIEEKQSQRFLFLNQLYKITDGNQYAMANIYDIAKSLNFDNETAIKTAQYLIGEGLAEFKALGGVIGITHYGIKEIENALSNKNNSTKYFPPVINIMHKSQIIQNSNVSNTNFQIVDNSKLNDLELDSLLNLLNEYLTSSNFSKEKKNEVISDIETIKIQKKSPNPKKKIIIESLKSISNIFQTIPEASKIVNNITKILTSNQLST